MCPASEARVSLGTGAAQMLGSSTTTERRVSPSPKRKLQAVSDHGHTGAHIDRTSSQEEGTEPFQVLEVEI